MEFEEYKKIVDNAVESGVKRVVFTGWGEPTVNRSILDMLSYGR
jgi:molybdenum cofactor biosynthesis enzyme MoaA